MSKSRQTGNLVSNNSIFVNSNGNVGIGTDIADQKLEVYGGKIFIDGGSNRKITLDPGSNATYDSRIDASHGLVLRSYVDAGAGVKTCTFTTNGDLDLTEGRNLKFAAGNGIDFSATADSSGTMTSELLDDYEEGTWTPTIKGGTAVGTATYAEQHGSYVKVGKLVTLTFYLQWSSGTGSGTLMVGDLPYSTANNFDFICAGAIMANFITYTGDYIVIYSAYGSTNILFYTCANNTAWSAVSYDTGGSLIGSLTYQVD